MTEDDNDLKRMFEAQRMVDEGLAPSFGDVDAKSHTARDLTPADFGRKSVSLPVLVALAATSLSVVIVLANWLNIPRPDGSTASPTDLQELNQVCDSLLVKIEELDLEMMTTVGTVAQEMDWPTGTDSLIPFEALSFNVRTSP